ncbi:MAG: ABC transporter ATP-binding protein [Syntrophales bacterium]
MRDVLLDIRGLKKHFPLRQGFFRPVQGAVRAVDNVDLQVIRGETLGLVGESGCGKTTLGRMVMRLDDPSAGSIRFAGTDILARRGSALKEYRRDVQMIFQDPYSSLNPRKTAGGIIGEPLLVHHPELRDKRGEMTAEMMAVVGLDKEHLGRYPHEFSGGQRQRIGIARALILRPRLIVADEPVSALDVSIQAQILNLMKRLQREFSLTYLFITHDLRVVRHMSDRIAVMYLGKIVELGDGASVCDRPAHPYTRALIAAVPALEPATRHKPAAVHGEMPSPLWPPAGCAFHPRCASRIPLCERREPVLKQLVPGHWSACHLPALAGLP